MVVKIETFNGCDEKALKGTAEVAQLTTVYMCTGQGSQEPRIFTACPQLLMLFGKVWMPIFSWYTVFQSSKLSRSTNVTWT